MGSLYSSQWVCCSKYYFTVNIKKTQLTIQYLKINITTCMLDEFLFLICSLTFLLDGPADSGSNIERLCPATKGLLLDFDILNCDTYIFQREYSLQFI